MYADRTGVGSPPGGVHMVFEQGGDLRCLIPFLGPQIVDLAWLQLESGNWGSDTHQDSDWFVAEGMPMPDQDNMYTYIMYVYIYIYIYIYIYMCF